MARDEERTTNVPHLGTAETTSTQDPAADLRTDIVPPDELDALMREAQSHATDELLAMSDDTTTAVNVTAAPESDDDDELATAIAPRDDIASIVVAARALDDLDADTLDDEELSTNILAVSELGDYPDELDEGPTSIVPRHTASDSFERIKLPLKPDEFEETRVVHIEDAPSRSADPTDDDDDDEVQVEIAADPYVIEYTETVAKQSASGGKLFMALIVLAAIGAVVVYLAVR